MDSLDPFLDIEKKLTELEERMLEIPHVDEPTPLFVEVNFYIFLFHGVCVRIHWLSVAEGI